MFACIYIPNASGDARAGLLGCASTFSPRLESVSDGTVVFDVEGLERLFGSYNQIATKVANEVRARGFGANVAIASNTDAAICAARGFGGITILENGSEARRLRDLPLSVLSPSLEIAETLERWGIRTLGAFAKLPVVDVSARLGQEGVQLHKRACGASSRPLAMHRESMRFIEAMELDYEIFAIESLTFILSRLMDIICAQLRIRNLATHEIHLSLGASVRCLNLPLPVRNSKLLTKLLILDLEARPPGTAIRRVEVEAIPTKPRSVQNGLFVPLSPEPEKLEVTLARLKAVVGEENVGAAEIADTHRPDAFRIQKFGVGVDAKSSPPLLSAKREPGRAKPQERGEPRPSRGSGGVGQSSFFDSTTHPSIALRRFRPPLDATVQLRNGSPAWIAFQGVHGPITTAGGPWRTSGDWWRPTMWDRAEWDIEVLDRLYRIHYDVHMDRWYAEGVYD